MKNTFFLFVLVSFLCVSCDKDVSAGIDEAVNTDLTAGEDKGSNDTGTASDTLAGNSGVLYQLNKVKVSALLSTGDNIEKNEFINLASDILQAPIILDVDLEKHQAEYVVDPDDLGENLPLSQFNIYNSVFFKNDKNPYLYDLFKGRFIICNFSFHPKDIKNKVAFMEGTTSEITMASDDIYDPESGFFAIILNCHHPKSQFMLHFIFKKME